MGYMPFFMVYDAEAVLPTDLDYRAPRVIAYRELEAKEYLEDAVDQLDEARDVTPQVFVTSQGMSLSSNMAS
jgi:hypothetical protein